MKNNAHFARGMTLGLLAFVGFGALSLAACKKAPESKAATSSAAMVAGAEDSPGAEPRSELKYAFPANASAKFSMEIDQDMNIGGTEMILPTMTIDGDSVVSSTSGDAFKITQTMENLGAKDRPKASMKADAMSQQLAGFKGFAVTADLAANGTASNLETKVPPGLSPQMAAMADSMKQSMENLMPHLPNFPVGVGGRWNETKSVTQNGVTITIKSTTELISREGNLVTLRTKADISAPKQKLQQGGASYDVNSVTGGGVVDSQVDLTKPIANSTGDISITMDMGATKIDMRTVTRTSAK